MGKNAAMLGAAGMGAYYLKQMMNKVSRTEFFCDE